MENGYIYEIKELLVDIKNILIWFRDRELDCEARSRWACEPVRNPRSSVSATCPQDEKLEG